ncbi:protein PTST, chloroplastic [Dendrobium catenatum]|uniref:protein PTST, chloroplastic n=1 Tax=Dendrobium catenatum TaxID=906689 RepID=UPI00109F1F8C|nr:protein PTST, chloroplastic [Dendrobium catenatum]
MVKMEYYCILPKSSLPFSLWSEPRSSRFQNDLPPNLPQNCKCTGIIYSMTSRARWCSPMTSFTASNSLNHGASSWSEDHLSNGNIVSEGASEKDLPQKLGTDELKSLLLDSERSKLLKKLSEANQYNRFLKRQLQIKDDVLVSLNNEVALLELESQALVNLAEEVANSVVQPGSRKINGKYIQSHLLSRLQAVHERLKEKIKDANSLKFEEVTLVWIGMAESVQVMGSFDGWSQGEEMSPEYSGNYSRFSATLKLRPGRYEVKFLVDGEWLLSPELPTVGEGMLKNNLLIVE